MPYFSNQDLPSEVRAELPAAAQNTYRDAYNHAWERYAGNGARKQIADRLAWEAVRSRYQRVGREWVLYTKTFTPPH